VRTKSEDWKAK